MAEVLPPGSAGLGPWRARARPAGFPGKTLDLLARREIGILSLAQIDYGSLLLL